jgi:hypothetical protein
VDARYGEKRLSYSEEPIYIDRTRHSSSFSDHRTPWGIPLRNGERDSMQLFSLLLTFVCLPLVAAQNDGRCAEWLLLQSSSLKKALHEIAKEEFRHANIDLASLTLRSQGREIRVFAISHLKKDAEEKLDKALVAFEEQNPNSPVICDLLPERNPGIESAIAWTRWPVYHCGLLGTPIPILLMMGCIPAQFVLPLLVPSVAMILPPFIVSEYRQDEWAKGIASQLDRAIGKLAPHRRMELAVLGWFPSSELPPNFLMGPGGILKRVQRNLKAIGTEYEVETKYREAALAFFDALPEEVDLH